MKIRLAACLLGIFLACTLSGCVRSCYKSAETVLTQDSVGDPSMPEVSIAKFPAISQRDSSACQIANPVRVELYIDVFGQVQGVNFLDPWPMDCANEYVRHMRLAKVVDAPLFHPLEHFRVDIHESIVNNRQCIHLEQ